MHSKYSLAAPSQTEYQQDQNDFHFWNFSQLFIKKLIYYLLIIHMIIYDYSWAKQGMWND